jgi:galactokinase
MTRAGGPERFALLRAALGGSPETVRFARAPGRVNLIGDHTDYQDGLCLPIAIDRDVLVGFRPRADGHVRVRSLDLDVEIDLATPVDETITTVDGWARPIVATLALLAPRFGGAFGGFDAAISSTVPIGSGLSSSAAFDVALAIVTATIGRVELTDREVALTAQEVEHRASGVPCGLMDQLASVGGQAGHALLVDCRSLEITPVPMPDAAGVLVVHSGLERRLAASAYGERRAACEAAAQRLGIATLRDATVEQVAHDPIARHVVTENARVQAFAHALEQDDLARAGSLMVESHRSLRDDFAVSTPELDLLVELALDAGAFGARLTGAGFGGCVVVLVASGDLDRVAASVRGRYGAETGREPAAFAVTAVGGAGLVEEA